MSAETTHSDTAIHEHEHEHDSHSHDHSHDRDHEHGRDHEHLKGDVVEAAPHGGFVVLDIGGTVGAVVARLDDDQEGTELPILALDDPDWDPTTHTGVWRRPTGRGSVVVAVYPQLEQGRYRITVPSGRVTDLDVVGGTVTELDLRTSTSTAAAADELRSQRR